jgi:tetratricopeptide (TPR) repeat protein
LAGQPLFILAAWRSDEGQPAARLAGLAADAQRAGLGTALTLNNLALARAESGGLAQAITLAEQALALGVAMGDRHREAALHNNLADLLHAAGRSEEAMAQLKQAVVIFAEIGVEAGDAGPEIWKLTEW